ncbi:MAG: OmpH family outer membrane protein [Deltaproteobacteria bacterium]|nr:OmpH family outer membrane protein [Deltaproteobacteria bacterium]
MKKIFWITTIVIGMLFTGLVSVYAADSGFKFGYIDLQKVMALSSQGEIAKGKMQAKQEELRAEMQTKQSEISAMKEEIERQGMMLSPEKRQEKESDYQKMVRDFKIFVSDSEKDMKALEGEFLKKMLKELEVVTEEFGKSGKYQLILEKRSGIIYADQAHDISDELITAYNKWVENNQKEQKKEKK